MQHTKYLPALLAPVKWRITSPGRFDRQWPLPHPKTNCVLKCIEKHDRLLGEAPNSSLRKQTNRLLLAAILAAFAAGWRWVVHIHAVVRNLWAAESSVLWQCILSVTIRTRAGYGWVLTFATFSPHTLQIEAIQLLNNVKCRHGTFEGLCCSSNSTKQQALPQEPKSLFAQSGSWKRKCHVNQRICRKCTILLALQALEALCTRREMGWCWFDH